MLLRNGAKNNYFYYYSGVAHSAVFVSINYNMHCGATAMAMSDILQHLGLILMH